MSPYLHVWWKICECKLTCDRLTEVGSVGSGWTGVFVVSNWWLDSEHATTMSIIAVLLLVATYISSICMLYDHICIACMGACIQIYIIISWRSYFIEMSLNNTLPQPYDLMITYMKLGVISDFSLFYFMIEILYK